MPMLTVSGLTKRFGALRAVNDVSFEVNEGEILGLIGPNGSGKSTTFNCIAGLYAPNAGSIRFEGAEIAGLKPDRVCHKGIGRTFQIPRPFRNLTLVENVALSAFFGQDRGASRADCWQLAEEALTLVGLPADPRVTTDGLGAAALKKLELARALATQPKLRIVIEVQPPVIIAQGESCLRSHRKGIRRACFAHSAEGPIHIRVPGTVTRRRRTIEGGSVIAHQA